MESFNQNHARALYVRFCAIYGDKFVKEYHDNDFKLIWYAEWTTGLEGIDVNLIKGALEHCKLNLSWAPTVGEFRQICEQASGVPSAEEAMAKAIRGDFSHPVIAIAYDKVGSWAMRNSKEAELLAKFKAAYQEALQQFRSQPSVAYLTAKTLSEHRAKALPLPPKVPSSSEIIGWRERLARYKEMAAVDKMKLEKKDHPTWPKNQITPRHRDFDEKVFNERRKYLIELDEMVASTLPVEDWYDRTRYLRELSSPCHLNLPEDYGYQKEIKTPPRASSFALHVVK